MKFGFRVPSLKKKFAARTSLKRMVRSKFRAPRGAGIFTNPKRALYNRVYNRTTFGFGGGGGAKAKGGKAGCGCVWFLLIFFWPLALVWWLVKRFMLTGNNE